MARPHDVVTPSLITGPGNAALWSRLLGKEIRYMGHNFDQWEQAMRSRMPGWSAFDLRRCFRATSIAASRRPRRRSPG